MNLQNGMRHGVDEMSFRDWRTGYNDHAIGDHVLGEYDSPPTRGPASSLDGAADALAETAELEAAKPPPELPPEVPPPDFPKKKGFWGEVKDIFKATGKYFKDNGSKLIHKVLPKKVADNVIKIGEQIGKGIGKAFHAVSEGSKKVGHAIKNSKFWKAIVNSKFGRFIAKWAPRAFRWGKRLFNKVGGYVMMGVGVAYDIYDTSRTIACSVKIAKGEKNLPGICDDVKDDIEMFKELGRAFGKKNG